VIADAELAVVDFVDPPVDVDVADGEAPLAPKLDSGVLDMPVVPLETAFPGRLTVWVFARA